MSIELLKQSLEVIYEYVETYGQTKKAKQVMPELRQAIAEAEKQEPVAWKLESGQAVWFERTDPEAASALPPDVTMTPLYTHPQPRKPLTDEQIGELKGGYQSGRIGSFVELVKTIEEAHGIKE